jgi:hypothetical protein
MDHKGKGIVINDKEKESFVNEPKDDKPTDSGSGHKRKDGKKKTTRRIKEIIYYDDSDESTSSQKATTTTTTTKERRSIQTFLSITLVFHRVQMHICFLSLLASLHTLMGRTTDFGVTKCVVTCSLSIQAYGRLLRVE